MPGRRSLLLVLLALAMGLPPAPAQQHRTRHRGAAPTVTAAPRVWRPRAALPAPGKAGECPAGGHGAPRAPGRFCLSDRGCPGTEKCCRSGPGRACRLPATESPGYCPRSGSASGASCGASCSNDTACSPGEKCCARGCCARCLRAEPAKPGLCPRKRVQRSAVACSNRCADDRDCPGDRKCCFSGCGLACASPDRGSRHAEAKPGTCPVVLRGSLGPCLELCDTDSDCPGAAKCCTTGCGHICKPPTEAHPGLCPPVADGDRSAECLLLCLQDRDCPREQKCCLRGCGRTCVPPLQGKTPSEAPRSSNPGHRTGLTLQQVQP
ncbi:WAP four-disulfide core domain protein 3-like [Lathamus discolor]|uniref:WAP four-disulfide core domain protein 3-like n=1 Tax=Lathamus discolor TaxID=678569 RepID=UPI0032B83B24